MRPRSRYPLATLAGLGLPGLAWVTLFVGVSVYVLLAVAFGSVDDILFEPHPAWSPLDWQTTAFQTAFDGLAPGGEIWSVFARTCVYIAIAVVLCVLIGYPVAYYVAVRAGRAKPLWLVLLVLPLLVSYMLRMLAWVGLLAPDGYVNRSLEWLHLISGPQDWLDGRASTVVIALAYGWVPYFILPLYASLERLDLRYLEAARDLGASPTTTFLKVTLPLSRQGILAGLVLIALPMFGDYYTNALVSGAPSTSMLGNLINTYVESSQQRTVGAALSVLLLVVLGGLLTFYLRSSTRAARAAAA